MTSTPKSDASSSTTENKIRVILVEDQAMALCALAALLEMESDITVVAHATNGRAALNTVIKFTPDVLHYARATPTSARSSSPPSRVPDTYVAHSILVHAAIFSKTIPPPS